MEEKHYLKNGLIIILVVLGIIVILAISPNKWNSKANKTAMKTGTKPVVTTTTATTPAKTTPVETTPAETTPVEEIISVSALDLLAVFNSNEIKANSLYKDKTIEVTGIVKNVSETFGTVTVTMGASEDLEWTQIRAYFKDKSENVKIAELNVDQETTIIGKCTGKGFDVTLNDCKIK